MDGKIPTEEELRAIGNPAIDYYLDHIAPELSDADKGRYIAIDEDSGEWEIDDTEACCARLQARIPNARIHVIRHITIVSDHPLTPFLVASSELVDLSAHQLADENEEFGE